MKERKKKAQEHDLDWPSISGSLKKCLSAHYYGIHVPEFFICIFIGQTTYHSSLFI
jgi:hypothetical protein